MPKRSALIIGNSRFAHADNFPLLTASVNDARDLGSVLGKYGEFQIAVLENEGHEAIADAIDRFYSETESGDLTLLYYSGHGDLDKERQFYLIASDTNRQRLPSTGISEWFLTSVLRKSRSRHNIIIFDCCFSGAFVKNKKGGEDKILLENLRGEALAIMTSSNAVQYSFENEEMHSRFTQALIKGIVSGDADKDGDGVIELNELFQFVAEQLKIAHASQTPVLFLSVREVRLNIASNPKQPAKQRLAQIDKAQFHRMGIVLGQQRLEMLEQVSNLQEQLVRFRSAAKMREDFWGIVPHIADEDWKSASVLWTGIVIALGINYMRSSETWKPIEIMSQELILLIKLLLQAGLERGLDKLPWWSTIESSLGDLSTALQPKPRTGLAGLTHPLDRFVWNQGLAKLDKAESSLAKLAATLDAWSVLETETQHIRNDNSP